MGTNVPVPDSDHITRLCTGSKLTEDGQATGACFQLKPGEPDLSVNWLEHLKLLSRDDEIREIQRVFGTKMKRVGATSKLALLNVGKMRSFVQGNTHDARNIRVLHSPADEEPVDPSHSSVFDTRENEDMIIELIAQMVLETFPAK